MSNHTGFSLIEVTVVIALFAFIMTIGFAHSKFMYYVVVKQEIQKLALICRSLQQAAMMSNVPKVLTFDLKRKSYLYDGASETLPMSVEFGILPGTMGPPSNPTRQIDSPITFEQEKIIFHPDGIIQPGTVYLISKDKQIMYALSSPVSQVSYMRIYKYDGAWQCLS